MKNKYYKSTDRIITVFADSTDLGIHLVTTYNLTNKKQNTTLFHKSKIERFLEKQVWTEIEAPLWKVLYG